MERILLRTTLSCIAHRTLFNANSLVQRPYWLSHHYWLLLSARFETGASLFFRIGVCLLLRHYCVLIMRFCAYKNVL